MFNQQNKKRDLSEANLALLNFIRCSIGNTVSDMGTKRLRTVPADGTWQAFERTDVSPQWPCIYSGALSRSTHKMAKASMSGHGHCILHITYNTHVPLTLVCYYLSCRWDYSLFKIDNIMIPRACMCKVHLHHLVFFIIIDSHTLRPSNCASQRCATKITTWTTSFNYIYSCEESVKWRLFLRWNVLLQKPHAGIAILSKPSSRYTRTFSHKACFIPVAALCFGEIGVRHFAFSFFSGEILISFSVFVRDLWPRTSATSFLGPPVGVHRLHSNHCRTAFLVGSEFFGHSNTWQQLPYSYLWCWLVLFDLQAVVLIKYPCHLRFYSSYAIFVQRIWHIWARKRWSSKEILNHNVN